MSFVFEPLLFGIKITRRGSVYVEDNRIYVIRPRKQIIREILIKTRRIIVLGGIGLF
jgi:hypothetical protein